MVAVANGENAVALFNVTIVNRHVRLDHADHVSVARLKVFAAVNFFVARVGFFLRPPLAKPGMFLHNVAVVPHSDQLADRHVGAVRQKARVHHACRLRRKQEGFGRDDVDTDFGLRRVFADLDGRQAGFFVSLAFHDVETTIKQRGKLGVVSFNRFDLFGAVVLVIDFQHARFEQQAISDEVGQDREAVVLARKDMIDQGGRGVGLCHVVGIARDKANDFLTTVKNVHQRRQQIMHGVAYIGRNDRRAARRHLVERFTQVSALGLNAVVLKLRVAVIYGGSDFVVKATPQIVVIHLSSFLGLPRPRLGFVAGFFGAASAFFFAGRLRN